MLFTVRCSTSMAWETMIHSKSNKKHDRKSERILSGALKISSQLVQMSLSCKTWLISSFLFPTIHFHAKIIKREYFSSAPWKQPCHWLETVSRMLRIQQGTGFSSLLGLIWFPLLLFYWRITLMCFFFLAKICTSCLGCIYYTVSTLCVLSSVRNITIPYYTPYAFGKTTVASYRHRYMSSITHHTTAHLVVFCVCLVTAVVAIEFQMLPNYPSVLWNNEINIFIDLRSRLKCNLFQYQQGVFILWL